jgi:hypothetical protein
MCTVMDASVWMYSISLPFRPSCSLGRFTELITPAVTVFESDKGLPIATANSPGLTLCDEPNFSTGSLRCNYKTCHQ